MNQFLHTFTPQKGGGGVLLLGRVLLLGHMVSENNEDEDLAIEVL